MDCKSFIAETVLTWNQPIFEQARDVLLKQEYIKFEFTDNTEEISKEILSEKIYDQLRFLTLRSKKERGDFDKYFDKQVKSVFSILAAVVEPKVAKTPKKAKGNADLIAVPRTRKYYEQAVKISKEPLSVRNCLTCTRVLMCLYAAIVSNNHMEISDFNYSVYSLFPLRILSSLMKEQHPNFVTKKRKKFDDDGQGVDVEGAYRFILAVVLLYTVLNQKIEGDFYHE